MKANQKARIIGLSVILAVLLVGVGVLSWKLLVPKDGGLDIPKADGVSRQIYTETLLKETPDDHCDIVRMGDRIVARVGSSKDLVDINTWESAYTWPTSWAEQNLDIHLIAFDNENNIYGLIYSEETKQASIIKHYTGSEKPDETIVLQGIHTDAKKGKPPVIKKLMVDDEYIYVQSYVNVWEGVQVFTHDGALHAEYDEIRDFDIDNEGSIYLLERTNQFVPISRREVKTDKLVFSLAAEKATVTGDNFFLERNSGLLCLSSRNEVSTYNAKDGSPVNIIMDKVKNASSLGLFAQAMMVDSEFNIYFVDYAGEGDNVTARFFKYFLAEDTRRDMPYTLTVTAPYRDDYFSRVISKFEQENPEEKIKYDYAYNSKMEFGMKSNDDGYFDKLKLKLMTEDVGDVVMVGNVYNDMHQLLTRGLFENLKPLIEKDPSYKDLDEKMLDGITINGEIGTLPLAAIHRYMQINETLCGELGINLDWENATWSDILALTEKLEGTEKYLFSAPEGSTFNIFVRMVISNMPELINLDTVKMDLRQPWFLELIEQWKAASQNPNFSENTANFNIAPNALINMFWNTEITWDSDMVYSGIINAKQERNVNLRQFPLPIGEKNANRASWSEDMYSISASSKNKDAAWELLSLAMSEEMQSLNAMRNRPLNTVSRGKSMKEAEKATIERFPEMSQQIKTFYNDMRKVYSNVDYMYDMGIGKEHLFYPLLDYVDGKITLDEALTKAEHDILIWLSE